MDEINFVTMGSSKYFPFLNYSSKLLQYFNSNYKLFIYDLGFTELQRKRLCSDPNITVVDWKDIVKKKSNISLKPELDPKKWFILMGPLKPECILDCLKRVKSQKIVYIDGDAFVINPIDKIFNKDFEIGVTIRLYDTTISRGRKLNVLSYINAGVIFFNLDPKKMEIFLKRWIEEVNNTSGHLKEQTALNKLIYCSNKNIFSNSYSKGNVMLSNKNIRIMTFPCHKYNHYEIKLGYLPKNNKILHLKVSMYKEEINKNSIREIALQFRLGVFYYHFLRSFPKKIRRFIKEIFSLHLIIKLIMNPWKINQLIKQLIKPLIKKMYET